MPVINVSSEWTHQLPDVKFRSLATPTRGTRENSVWRVRFEPGASSAPHSLTREEIFVVLSGQLRVDWGGSSQLAQAGDAIVVPPDTIFTAHAQGGEPTELLCCFPVGGQARLASGELITPPWAQ
jgi:quercetin dioxygenase-like cupin family protein